MNSRTGLCKSQRKKGKLSRCLRLSSDSKKLDCQCPKCLSGKRYVRCIRSSRLTKRRRSSK